MREVREVRGREGERGRGGERERATKREGERGSERRGREGERENDISMPMITSACVGVCLCVHVMSQ